MKISTRARYGTRLMLELGVRYGRGPVLLGDIARAEEISEKYLSQIIIPLRSAGLVNSVRGAKGGYMLARPPFAITLREIVEVLEGGLDLAVSNNNNQDSEKASQRVMRDVWKMLGDTISRMLSEMTVETLLKMYRDKREETITYNI